MSAPADQDASHSYTTHSVLLGGGGGGARGGGGGEGDAGDRERWVGDPSHSYAVSDQDCLVVVTQCQMGG